MKEPGPSCRYYRIAGLTIRVESDLPMAGNTFHDDLELFRVDGPGEDNVSIHHHFQLPEALRGKILFVVAHRLSTIRQADWILLLKDGRIDAAGTPADLFNANEYFRSLAEPSTP